MSQGMKDKVNDVRENESDVYNVGDSADIAAGQNGCNEMWVEQVWSCGVSENESEHRN